MGMVTLERFKYSSNITDNTLRQLVSVYPITREIAEYEMF